MVRLFLERRGFDVAEADSSASALIIMDKVAPNLVVVDDELDGVSTGVELALIVASRRPETMVLVLSAYLRGEERFFGVNAILHKADIARVGELADTLVPPDTAEPG